MFDIGFSELLLVLVIGLIVLGPERLPGAVKTVAGWIRAVRSLATSVQQELAQELKLQELQDSLKKVEEAGKDTLSPELKESIKELRKTADSVKRSYHESMETGHQGDNASPAAAPSATLQSTAESTVADTPDIDQPLAASHNSSPAKETPLPAGEDK